MEYKIKFVGNKILPIKNCNHSLLNSPCNYVSYWMCKIRVRFFNLDFVFFKGVDPDTVYYNKDVTQKELVGEPNLRHQVIMPNDFCVALSQDVNGTFFSSHPISKASPNEIKNFKTVFSRKFSKSIQHFSCQWCECTSTRDHLPNTVCQSCEIKRPRLPFFIGSSVSARRRTLEAFISYLFHMVDPNEKPVY